VRWIVTSRNRGAVLRAAASSIAGCRSALIAAIGRFSAAAVGLGS
jgi:hypothetical protein